MNDKEKILYENLYYNLGRLDQENYKNKEDLIQYILINFMYSMDHLTNELINNRLKTLTSSINFFDEFYSFFKEIINVSYTGLDTKNLGAYYTDTLKLTNLLTIQELYFNNLLLFDSSLEYEDNRKYFEINIQEEQNLKNEINTYVKSLKKSRKQYLNKTLE